VTDATKAQCPYGGTYFVFVIYFPWIPSASYTTLFETCRAVEVGTKVRNEVVQWTFCSACYIFLHGGVHVPTARNPNRRLQLNPNSCFTGMVLDGVSSRVMVRVTHMPFPYLSYNIQPYSSLPQDFHERVRANVLPTWLPVVKEYYRAMVSIVVCLPTCSPHIHTWQSTFNGACRNTHNSLNPSIQFVGARQRWKKTLSSLG